MEWLSATTMKRGGGGWPVLRDKQIETFSGRMMVKRGEGKKENKRKTCQWEGEAMKRGSG